MKAISFRSLALASLASLAMATSSSAVTILQFNQQFPTDSVTAVVVGTTTQLRTSSALDPNSIPVLIGNIGGTTLGTPLPAFETFINVVSTGTATTAGGEIQQLYSGTIAVTSGPNNTGGNFLTATFQNAVLSGAGNAGGLSGSRPPQNVTFTSNFAQIVPLIAGNPPENFTIGFSGINPGLTITGGTIAGFTARNTGTFDTGTAAVVPEPSGLVMAGMALIGGLGFGWRRRQSSRA